MPLYVALLSGNKPDRARTLLAISDRRLVSNIVRAILEGVNQEADEVPADNTHLGRPTEQAAVMAAK